MDALALLCNLHADGPFTLQRLRRSGCESLDVLLELPALQLSTHLDGSERTAERFLREAQLLAERLEDQTRYEVNETDGRPRAGFGDQTPEEFGAGLDLDSALEPEPEAAPEQPARELSLEESLAEDELDEDEAEYDEAYGHGEEADEFEADEFEADEFEADEVELDEVELDDHDLAAEKEIETVLDTWREADLDSPPDDPTDYVVPRPEPPSTANQALDELRLEGVAPALRERLGEIGILSLRGLIDAPPLDLARNLPLGFTRVKHIQFLARRLWNEREEQRSEPGRGPIAAPRSYDELVAVERLDASGPFAGDPGL